MRTIDLIAVVIAALAVPVFLYVVVAVVARIRWDQDFAHDKALLKQDPSGELWRERGRL